MEESILTGLTGLTPQQQIYVTWLVMICSALGKLYSSITNGGGLKKIFTRLWLGENLPKVVADDYKAELETTNPKQP